MKTSTKRRIPLIVAIIAIIVMLALIFILSGCSQAERVSYNLSQEADNFNVVRKVTVINGFTNDIMFQMTGKLSIETDVDEEQLEITVEMEEGQYRKHFVNLGDNATVVTEDLGGADVSNYKYTLNFNPRMWIPFDVDTID